MTEIVTQYVTRISRLFSFILALLFGFLFVSVVLRPLYNLKQGDIGSGTHTMVTSRSKDEISSVKFERDEIEDIICALEITLSKKNQLDLAADRKKRFKKLYTSDKCH
ncbi:hypothetical protein GI584_19355 [Gracilibacillus salitolerans]|uniref:Uncharacterized protein n=1 Tax=Gracilibacillus salitolerans TaxID=2663022 RepID=A0A5Q2TM77_9BACI|nr:hypothetical protein [Gracilibacillus salitolerans]QGH36074.1 hypothetical protein GI584_19355 [Gracilibacillus salitolerans]